MESRRDPASRLPCSCGQLWRRLFLLDDDKLSMVEQEEDVELISSLPAGDDSSQDSSEQRRFDLLLHSRVINSSIQIRLIGLTDSCV